MNLRTEDIRMRHQGWILSGNVAVAIGRDVRANGIEEVSISLSLKIRFPCKFEVSNPVPSLLLYLAEKFKEWKCLLVLSSSPSG